MNSWYTYHVILSLYYDQPSQDKRGMLETYNLQTIIYQVNDRYDMLALQGTVMLDI